MVSHHVLVVLALLAVVCQQGAALPTPTHFWDFDDADVSVLNGTPFNWVANSPQSMTRTAGVRGRATLFDHTSSSNGYYLTSQDSWHSGPFTLTFWAMPDATHEIDGEANNGYGGVYNQR
jgi:hypothetical protein